MITRCCLDMSLVDVNVYDAGDGVDTAALHRYRLPLFVGLSNEMLCSSMVWLFLCIIINFVMRLFFFYSLWIVDTRITENGL